MRKIFYAMALCSVIGAQVSCSSSSDSSDNGNGDGNGNGNGNNPGTNEVSYYLTKGDESVKLQLQTDVLDFNTTNQVYPSVIEVNDNSTFQTVDGFGYTLTGGSVDVINSLTTAKRQELLNDIFSADGIGVSYLRISIGASDLSAAPFTYNDLPAGQTDVNLANFSLAPDAALITMLKDILAINTNIKIIATPWSPPLWMKTNESFIGGSLKPEYANVYAQYFVKYIQGMAAEGITITAVTPQNEPLHDGNNPSLLMPASNQRDFIKNNLGPAFAAANISTKIIVYDHNCDNTAYPLTILNDAAAKQFVDGTAFHLYAGDISALSTVKAAHQDKNVYFTEQYTASNGSFSGDLKWHLKNVIIGSMRNWSKNALEWNLANDGGFGPHTDGGCTTCKGALTVMSSDAYQKNVAYYIIAHASKFVPAGSVRVNSNNVNGLKSVAFKRPDGKHVLIVENDNDYAVAFNLKYNAEWVNVTLAGASVGTFVW